LGHFCGGRQGDGVFGRLFLFSGSRNIAFAAMPVGRRRLQAAGCFRRARLLDPFRGAAPGSDLGDAFGQTAALLTHRTPCGTGGLRRATDATHLAHEVCGLACEPLVGGSELRTQFGDCRGLLIGLRLRRVEPRL
jgi:hypothetical protein